MTIVLIGFLLLTAVAFYSMYKEQEGREKYDKEISTRDSADHLGNSVDRYL